MQGEHSVDLSRLGFLKKKDRLAVTEFYRLVMGGPLKERIREMRLFGSKARGEDLPESDIDILVITTDPVPGMRDQIVDTAFDVNLTYDVYISPRVIAAGVFEDPVWSITPFIQALEREGVRL